MSDSAAVTATTTGAPWRVDIADGAHLWHADEPPATGGKDTAPTPVQLLSGALAACTAMTIQMYAARKQWPLTRVTVSVTKQSVDGATEFVRDVKLEGTLDEEQRARLLGIANKCPTHKILSGTIRIPTRLTA